MLTFIHDTEFTSENQGMSADIIRRAFLATEEEFLSLVENEWQTNPRIASVGSCCLVGIICNGVLYIANAGDSRAVLAREEKTMNAIKAVKVSEEHNAKFVSVREELRTSHPNDENIVVLKHNVWRVRGLIQVLFVLDLIILSFLSKNYFFNLWVLYSIHPLQYLCNPFELPIKKDVGSLGATGKVTSSRHLFYCGKDYDVPFSLIAKL